MHGFGVFSVCERCEQRSVFVTVGYEVLVILILVGNLLTRK